MMMKQTFALKGDEYEVIKKRFKELRKEYKFVNKSKFPFFKWVGNSEFVEAKYVREYNPILRSEVLISAEITWIGDDITHFLVDLKSLIKTVK